jgi:uncharacterized damage-inducible protein DinB
MPSIDHIQVLFAYHFETTQRLIASARGLPEEVIAPVGDLLFHINSADRGWRIGLETGQRPERLDRSQYPDLAAIAGLFVDEAAAWAAYLDGLAPGDVDGEVKMRSGDRVLAFARWHVMHHVLLHGMQHHAEIAEKLTLAGKSPGDIDFIFYGLRP